MIKFMVLADNALQIKEFYKNNSGGSIDIEYCYSSLSANIREIENSNIRIDKLLIVFSEKSNMNIRQEMQCLLSLMEQNSYFRLNQILVYSEDNEYCQQGLKYFKHIVNVLNFTDYEIKTYSEGLTLKDIYRDTLAIVPPEQEKTSYNRVYRVRKGENSVAGYSPRLHDRIIVPDVRDGVGEYEKVKANAVKAETNRLITEPSEKVIDKIDVSTDVFTSDLSQLRNVVIFTGLPRTGTSILATKTFLQLHDCLLLDISSNRGSIHHLNKESNDVEFVSPKDLLLGENYLDGKLRTIYASDKNTDLDLLKYILSVPNRLKYETLIIDTDLSALEDLLKILQTKIRTIVFTSSTDEFESKTVEDLLNRVEDINKFIFFNDCFKYEVTDKLDFNEFHDRNPSVNLIMGSNLNEPIDLSIFYK